MIGPRVAVIGGDNAYSQIVTKTLLNHTGKMNMKPIHIDLDL